MTFSQTGKCWKQYPRWWFSLLLLLVWSTVLYYGLSWDLQGQLTEFNWLQILIYFRNSSVLEMMHLYSFLVHIPRKDLTILSLVFWSLCATVNIHLYEARLIKVTSKKFLYMWCLLRMYNRLFRFLCRIREVLAICPNVWTSPSLFMRNVLTHWCLCWL